jgi:hypothetical protein
MHIQKTSGKEFDGMIVNNLMVRYEGKWVRACRKKFDVINFKSCDCNFGTIKNWYLSRVTNGWPCGVHPNYFQIKKCYPRITNNYNGGDIIVFTILRNPIIRYLSEWNHVSLFGN